MVQASHTLQSLSNVRCLVLGGGGFIGSRLCNALVSMGATIQAFGRTVTFSDVLSRSVVWAGEFAYTASLAKVLGGQEIVFHLIGSSTPESSNCDPAADLMANTMNTLHLRGLCRAEAVSKIIFVFSGATVYGIPAVIPITENCPTDPISAYGISKLANEKDLDLYHRLYGINYLILRVSNPYGRYQSPFKRQGVVAALIHRALSGKVLDIWGTGDVVRDFIHVNDVVRDIEKTMDRGELPNMFKPSRASDVPINILDFSLITQEMGWCRSPRDESFDKGRQRHASRLPTTYTSALR